MKQKLRELKREVDKSIIIIRTFNIPFQLLIELDRKSADTQLNKTINQHAVIDMYRKVHTVTAEYTCF